MRSLDGWSALRIVDPDDLPVAQVLIKKVQPWATVAYCPGGFVTQVPVNARTFTKQIASLTKARLLYVRTHMITPTRFTDLQLSEHGWIPVHKPFSSGESLKMRLDSSETQRRDLLSFNWKRNLKRGEKHDNAVSIDVTPNATVIGAAHQELEILKGPAVNNWESSVPHINALIQGFGERLVTVTCTDHDGRVRAVRGAVITANGAVAFDMLASTTLEGRQNYSSYVTFWELANELSRRGVVRYDLGGVDEVNNKGVFDFKNGTGAVPITYGGEFDAASPKAIRPMLSRIVSRVA